MYFKNITFKILIANYVLFFVCVIFWVCTGIKFSLMGQPNMILYLIMAVIFVCSIFNVMGMYLLNMFIKHDAKDVNNLEHLNMVLRAQRHDYLNEIQVVYGLLELEEYQEARDYMKPVLADITKINLALKTAMPAVNALLQAKLETAEKNGMEMNLHIVSDIKGIKMEQWELSKVLANLIDNAMTAVGKNELYKKKKKIGISISENATSYIFSVANNGPVIPETQRELIFKSGYSTKSEQGHGLGLMIVKQILSENRGRIELESKENQTVFTVLIDK